VNNTLIFH